MRVTLDPYMGYKTIHLSSKICGEWDVDAASFADHAVMHKLEGEIKVGDHFIWEPYEPSACEKIEVKQVVTSPNSGEILIKSMGTKLMTWNSEDRFREACIFDPEYQIP
jgi:hypothetical protein